ncbi:MAG: ABC transporter substrate-binding protein [Thermodesulfobacteriota bacterium]
MKLMMKMKKILGVLAIVCLVLPPLVFGASAAPIEQVRDTVEGILAVMRDEALSDPAQKDERRTKLMALVDDRFDFMEMAKRSLGRNWKVRTKEERAVFQDLFADLLKNTYVGRIEAYSDEKIEYSKEIFGRNKSDRAKVYTKILKNGHEIPINYSLMVKGNEWLVYDVVIEGVSLVRNYRTEFGRILNKEKFPGLLSRIQEKIQINEEKREK